MQFPLLQKETDLGKVSDPEIPVFIKTRKGFELHHFLLDTGADFTMLPAFFAKEIGLNLSELPRSKSYGVEGRGIITFVSEIMLKLGRYPFKVKVLFGTSPNTPLILGRQGLFDRFNIKFDNRKKVIVLTPL